MQAIAWKAQVRLCGRFRKLTDRGKDSKKVTVAIARELCGFVWAIHHQVIRSGTGGRSGEPSIAL